MAIIHEATMTPDKLTFCRDWLAKQPWSSGLTVTERIGGYRFDDPRGRVGVEFVLLAAAEQVVHLPLTYRDAPLAGADDYLVTTAEHSVLGTRYVYDGCVDPVLVRVLLRAVLSGGTEARMEYHRRDGRVEEREAPARAKGSGSWRPDEIPVFDGLAIRRDGATAVVDAGGFEITVRRLLDGVPVAGDETLEVTWSGGHGTLVGVRALR